MMRTRYLGGSRARWLQIGARDVVAEEVEGAVEIIARVLRWSEVPRNVIDQRIAQARAETQASDRKQTVPRTPLHEHRALAELKIESVLIQENSAGAGHSAVALELRSTTGALVVAVRRGERLLEHPDPTRAVRARRRRVSGRHRRRDRRGDRAPARPREPAAGGHRRA